ncbi:MAG: FAD-dependent oxidoreductase [Gammaproteobacteria bacterium]|nr:FAD-dependent oxidoreductase [Gammaproteobacteria bacterium]
MNSASDFSREVDLAIVGGGIAGLWLANVLHARGFEVIVLEAGRLGGQQTLASQGMIHGGLKYALGGNLTGASEAIADMPERWRTCLNGTGEIDLTALTPLSERYYLFADASTLGRLTGFFASKSLRGRIERLNPADYPPVFQDPGFNGVVYALNDLVLDTPALLAHLQGNLPGRIFQHKLTPGEVVAGDSRPEKGVELQIEGGTIAARRLILCAGAGTQQLLDGLQIPTPQMQLRPLHQVVVRHAYPHPLYAHCLTGIRRAEPRLTITSHPDADGWLWYLGGQLASDGATMSEGELVAHARRELAACVPWVAWREAEFSTIRVDRAEPRQSGRQRPDEAFAATTDNVVVCWPTKLSLAPDLADKVLALAGPPPPRPTADGGGLPLRPAVLGEPPWALQGKE